jgi:hypothetical protein
LESKEVLEVIGGRRRKKDRNPMVGAEEEEDMTSDRDEKLFFPMKRYTGYTG